MELPIKRLTPESQASKTHKVKIGSRNQFS
jgi:hypothetical protein